MSDKLYRSRIVIEVLNNDGTAMEGPTNHLIDECSNLSAEEAAKHHYALKRAYGRVLNALTDEETATFKKAAGA